MRFALSGRVMPIQISTRMDIDERRGLRPVAVKSIPWEMISDEVSQRQCERNHGQTLDEVAGRGGLGASEAICVIAGISYRTFGADEDEHRILYAMRTMFNRGLLFEDLGVD